MYNIDLEKNEKIIYNKDHVKLYKDDKVYEVSVVVTNKRFFLLEDINKHVLYREFRMARGASFIPRMESIYETSLKDVKAIQDDNMLIVNDIVIDDMDLLEVLKK